MSNDLSLMNHFRTQPVACAQTGDLHLLTQLSERDGALQSLIRCPASTKPIIFLKEVKEGLQEQKLAAIE